MRNGMVGAPRARCKRNQKKKNGELTAMPAQPSHGLVRPETAAEFRGVCGQLGIETRADRDAPNGAYVVPGRRVTTFAHFAAKILEGRLNGGPSKISATVDSSYRRVVERYSTPSANRECTVDFPDGLRAFLVELIDGDLDGAYVADDPLAEEIIRRAKAITTAVEWFRQLLKA